MKIKTTNKFLQLIQIHVYDDLIWHDFGLNDGINFCSLGGGNENYLLKCPGTEQFFSASNFQSRYGTPSTVTQRNKYIHSAQPRGHICKKFSREQAPGPPRFMNLWHLSAQPLLTQRSSAINE